MTQTGTAVALAAALCSLVASPARAQYNEQARPEILWLPTLNERHVPFFLADVVPPTERDAWGLVGPVRAVKWLYPADNGDTNQHQITYELTYFFTQAGDLDRVESVEVRIGDGLRETVNEGDAERLVVTPESAGAHADRERRWRVTEPARGDALDLESGKWESGGIVRRTDERGRLVCLTVEMLLYDYAKTTVAYREDGTAIARLTTASGFGGPCSFIYEYDAEGKLVAAGHIDDIRWEGRRVTLNPDDPRDMVVVEFDEHGTPIAGTEAGWGSAEHMVWRTQATYDAHGNWTELITETYDPDERCWRLFRVIAREITYW